MECPQCGEEAWCFVNGTCIICNEENDKMYRQIDTLINTGHTEHCAKRQVYGDGECECRRKDKLNQY